MVSPRDLAVVIRGRKGRNIMLQSMGVDARTALMAANEVAQVLEGDAWRHGVMAAQSDVVDAVLSAHMPCLSAGHLRVLGGRARAVYRAVGRVAVVVVAAGPGAAGAASSSSSSSSGGQSAFAALALASAVSRLLVAECKTVDVSQERVERRFAQVYLGVASLLARGSGDVVQALLDVGAALGTLSGDASKAKKARLLADAAAAAAAKTAKPVGKRLADPRAALGGVGSGGAWPGVGFLPPVALQEGKGALPMPAFPAPPFPPPDAPRRRPAGPVRAVFLKDDEEEDKDEENKDPFQAEAEDAPIEAGEKDPFSGDAMRTLGVPSGPALRLLEVWGSESHGSRCVRAGLVGAVRWASAETKAVSGSVPFGLGVGVGEGGGGEEREEEEGGDKASGGSGGDGGASAADPIAAAALTSTGPPTPTVDREVLRLALKSAVAAAGAAAAAAGAGGTAAGGASPPPKGGVRPGPLAGSLLADGIAPLPASAPLLRYSLPAALAGPAPLMAHLTAGVVPYRLKRGRRRQVGGGGEAAAADGGDGGGGDGGGKAADDEKDLVAIVLVTLRFAVTREGVGEGRALGDLTLQLDVPRALGDPLRVDPSSASAAEAQAAAAAAALAGAAEESGQAEGAAAPSSSSARPPRRASHAGAEAAIAAAAMASGGGAPQWCPRQGALRWHVATPYPGLSGCVSAAFRVSGGGAAAVEEAARLLAAPAGGGQGGGGLRAVVRLRGAAGAGTLTGVALLQARAKGGAGATDGGGGTAGAGAAPVELAPAASTSEWCAVVVARPAIVSVVAPSPAALAAEAPDAVVVPNVAAATAPEGAKASAVAGAAAGAGKGGGGGGRKKGGGGHHHHHHHGRK